MRVISFRENAKAKVLAERYGWSLVGAQGYVEGELFRKRPNTSADSLPLRLLVGCDEYARGFRAGYFGRALSSTTLTGRLSERALGE